jgi:hypothetical protein
MMGPVGERRSIDKIDKAMDQAAPAAKDQSKCFNHRLQEDWADDSSPYS